MCAKQTSKPHNLRGGARLLAAFRNSKAGLRDIWISEEAFRLEVVIFILACPIAFCIGSGPGQVALLIGSLMAVLIIEILNSALEAIVDRIGPEQHELSRIAKDLGSAAVLLTALFPATAWGLIFLNFLGFIEV
ncbi:diacylglycerol kinase [uncultured Tateyamaria sp.]|uniref:diacylglycerol kinase n=1 Tax=uncultured Tateyamaria sp. TaxID=455651 RepID=UPI00261442E5|nr:diacylglycerol kinase [uncultured Tateyamaria sp.]